LVEWQLLSTSPEETRELGQRIGQLARPGTVLLLAGDLGSGKTCLAQGVGAGLGLPEEEPVTSPSYTLMNHYSGRLELYHFDLYRLEHPEDLDDLGFSEYLSGDGIVIVEWSQRFPVLRPEGLEIRFESLAENQRLIRFAARGESAGQLLQRIAADHKEPA